jgi:hypothetical protein
MLICRVGRVERNKLCVHGLELCDLGKRRVTDSCHHSDKNSASAKDREFLGQLIILFRDNISAYGK